MANADSDRLRSAPFMAVGHGEQAFVRVDCTGSRRERFAATRAYCFESLELPFFSSNQLVENSTVAPPEFHDTRRSLGGPGAPGFPGEAVGTRGVAQDWCRR